MKRFLGLAILAAMSPLGFASGTINAGDALYFVDSGSGATDRTGTGAGNSNFDPGAVWVDQLFQNWWWFRGPGDTREFALSNRVSETYSGNTGNMLYRESAAGYSFDAALNIQLFDGANDGEAAFYWTVVITNTGQSQLDLALFNYLDLDLGITGSTSDRAEMLAPGVMRIWDPTDLTTAIFHGPGASAFRIGAFAANRLTLVDAAVNNFGNEGNPFGPGDFTGGFQWDLSIAPGESVTVYESMGLVPEPSSLALLGLAAFALRRR
ncbi:MAG: PEP-CTERM sorting domain-containing protein [Phycisphaerales bacterium]|nr:PEP-CTERM sorting domain-containing protein [Phycisphaerales bacterium]